MITKEQLEEALGDNKHPFVIEKNIDYTTRVITLLRERIPYEECKRIIGGAEHDKIYLCSIDDVLPNLSEADLVILADCNCSIDEENDCLALFV